jgi:hypothetical protein
LCTSLMGSIFTYWATQIKACDVQPRPLGRSHLHSEPMDGCCIGHRSMIGRWRGMQGEEDVETLRAKLRGAVKKGKAIDKARAELEDTVATLRADLEVRSPALQGTSKAKHQILSKTACLATQEASLPSCKGWNQAQLQPFCCCMMHKLSCCWRGNRWWMGSEWC